jgi:hypothetical protein
MYHGFYGMGGFYGFWWPTAAILLIIPFWRLCLRIGHSPWLSLLLLIPLVNLIFVYFIAFSQWPSERGSTGTGGGAGPVSGPGPGPIAPG